MLFRARHVYCLKYMPWLRFFVYYVCEGFVGGELYSVCHHLRGSSHLGVAEADVAVVVPVYRQHESVETVGVEHDVGSLRTQFGVGDTVGVYCVAVFLARGKCEGGEAERRVCIYVVS